MYRANNQEFPIQFQLIQLNIHEFVQYSFNAHLHFEVGRSDRMDLKPNACDDDDDDVVEFVGTNHWSKLSFGASLFYWRRQAASTGRRWSIAHIDQCDAWWIWEISWDVHKETRWVELRCKLLQEFTFAATCCAVDEPPLDDLEKLEGCSLEHLKEVVRVQER